MVNIPADRGGKARWLPGDPKPKKLLASMIRVDQAGEYGAERIYKGQLMVFTLRSLAWPKNRVSTAEDLVIIRQMYEQELTHLAYFDHVVKRYGIRPTLLQALWHVGGFALGAASAVMGRKAAMACTIAVEEVIDKHYAEQLQIIEDMKSEDETEYSLMRDLASHISKFRAEEIEHKEIASNRGGEKMLGYGLFAGAVRSITKAAIAVAKKI